MKPQILLILFASYQFGCKAQKIAQKNVSIIHQGIYKQKGSSKKLELKPDGSYTLYNPAGDGHFEIKQCNYASKGKWKQMSSDVLEITSENYYQEQDGFKYELKKENKFSQDSLYIVVNLPDSLVYYKRGVPVDFSFTFNYNLSKSISTNKSLISLPKQKYLGLKPIEINHIDFSLNANVSGTTLYKSRIMFKMFEEDINTEKYNCLTITLPNFNLCFFEFEPYNQELIFIEKENELIWQGKNWEKIN